MLNGKIEMDDLVLVKKGPRAGELAVVEKITPISDGNDRYCAVYSDGKKLRFRDKNVGTTVFVVV